MYSLGRDINSEIKPYLALGETNALAGGTGDATAAPGATLDLQGLGGKAGSVVFVIHESATLAATKTLITAAKIETSADGSSWSDLVAAAALDTLTGESGGSTEAGLSRIAVNLVQSTVLRYIRLNVTPELDASGTDTAVIFATAIFGGFDELPQS